MLGGLIGKKLSAKDLVWCFANCYAGCGDHCPPHRDSRSIDGTVVVVLKSPGKLPFLISKMGPCNKDLNSTWEERLLDKGSMIAMAGSGVTHKFPSSELVTKESPRMTLNFFF